jgi:hypothetical protein
VVIGIDQAHHQPSAPLYARPCHSPANDRKAANDFSADDCGDAWVPNADNTANVGINCAFIFASS